jgi:4a-hydroxytetrahydrobiopterin dehydratase
MTTSPLADRKLAHDKLDDAAITALAREVPRWKVVRVEGRPPYLSLGLGFDSFASALAAANVVGKLADEVDHHPDLHVSWGKLGIDVWTHSAGGLSQADFVFAARVDRALAGAPGSKG